MVYVRQLGTDIPAFLMREVTLGPSFGGAYVVLDGLSDGEETVTNGVFSTDASAQLEGKRSMMNENGSGTTSMVGHGGYNMSGTHDNHAGSQSNERIMFTVHGSCSMCKGRIETAIKRVPGIRTVDWDQEKQMICLQFDPSKTFTNAAAKAIVKVGHDTDKYKADKAVYDTLPGCCKYRDK